MISKPDNDINGQGCLQPVLVVLLFVAAFSACVVLGWFLRLDATLEGDAKIYAMEEASPCRP